jgi:hypothetical protein
MGKFRDLISKNGKVALMADPGDVLIFVKVRQILERPESILSSLRTRSCTTV